ELIAEYQDLGCRYVGAVHEAGAVAMASAYSEILQDIGLATVTHGPGLTNTITALVDSVRSRARILIVTGDPPAEPTHLQRLDLSTMAAAAGVGYELVYSAGTIGRDVNRALRRIVAEARPIVLNVPHDLLW